MGIIEKIQKLRIQRGFRRLSSELSRVPAEQDLNKVLEFLFSKKGKLITPWQFKEEIHGFLTEFVKLKAKYVMEIGTANGGTLYAHCRLADDNATVISLDLPGGEFGGGYPDWKVPIYRKFAKPNQQLFLIRDDSHLVTSVSKIEEILGHNKLDYLFIDGDHSYEGVKLDFQNYSAFVRKGGLVVFHDIASHGNSACQVDKFWNEIKSGFQHREFVQDRNQGCYGVGVLIL